MEHKRKITCDEIAAHFNINKSTVSRALSGKGSMRPELRQEIIDYAKREGYLTDTEKKRSEKTENIAVVLPRNLVNKSAFFTESLMGVVECVSMQNYDVIVALEEGNTLTALTRLVENNKCDGVILLQVYEEDVQTRYLSGKGLPFIAVGTLPDDCHQVDTDTRFASRELVSGLLSQGRKRIAYIGGRRNFTVNKRRFRGYEQALNEQMINVDPDIVFHDVESPLQIRYAVENILKNRCDCILCGDDLLAVGVHKVLVEEGIHVPEEIWLASLYESAYTVMNDPPITAVAVDARRQSFLAAQLLLDLIRDKKVEKETRMSAKIMWRESTGHH